MHCKETTVLSRASIGTYTLTNVFIIFSALLLDKVLAEQKADMKNNCSSNMLKFFDFHKNLQNQVRLLKQKT